MKRLLFAVLFLLAGAVNCFGQAGSYQQVLINGQGRPLGGVSTTVCQGASISSASIASGVATLTMASNPITAGFTLNSSIVVYGFAGADGVLNSTITNGQATVYTISSISSTQITYATTADDYTATGSGLVAQQGNITTGCVPKATIYTDTTASNQTTQPLLTDGRGNMGFYALPGTFVIEYISQTVTPAMYIGVIGGAGASTIGRIQPIGSPLLPANFAFSGWGTGATISNISGSDTAFSFTMTAGTSPLMQPQVTLAFRDGPWNQIYSQTATWENGTGPASDIEVTNNLVSTTLTYLGLPISGQTYTITLVTIGTSNLVPSSPVVNVIVQNPTANQQILGGFSFTVNGPLNSTAGGSMAGTYSGNPNFSGTGTFAGLQCKNFENIRCVDATNTQGWTGSDFGAWINSAYASLPTVNGSTAGKIMLMPSATQVTQSTTVAITSPFVSVVGPGPGALQISCTMNADCWYVHDSPFLNPSTSNVQAGGVISGFTLLGQGSGNVNAVGLHWGDVIGERFQDLMVDNFRGTNSSCIWGDNTSGFSERNVFLNVTTGQASNNQNGCTKLWRFTNTGNTALSSSFAHNSYIAGRFSAFDGQTVFSIEGGNHNATYWDFTGNVATGTTAVVMSIGGNTWSGGSPTFVDGFVNIQGECTTPCTNGTLIKTVGASNNLFIRGGAGVVDIQRLMQNNITASVVRPLNDPLQGGVETTWLYGQTFGATFPNAYIFNPANPASNRQINIPDPIGNVNLGMNFNAGTGVYQTKRATAGCTTAASIGGICASAITVNWPVSFADTNYTAGCSAEGSPSNVPSAPYVATKANGSITVNYLAITAAAATWPTVDCWAIHD